MYTYTYVRGCFFLHRCSASERRIELYMCEWSLVRACRHVYASVGNPEEVHWGWKIHDICIYTTTQWHWARALFYVQCIHECVHRVFDNHTESVRLFDIDSVGLITAVLRTNDIWYRLPLRGKQCSSFSYTVRTLCRTSPPLTSPEPTHFTFMKCTAIRDMFVRPWHRRALLSRRWN